MPVTSSTPPAIPETPDRDPERFFGLSTAQVTGSALAAGTSALAASFLGVAGTIIGALVGSLVATVASAVYSHSLRRAGQRLRVLRPVPVHGRASAQPQVVEGPLRAAHTRRWPRLAVAGVAGAVLALGAITGIEGLLGHPLSDSSRSGTSVADAFGGQSGTVRQAPVQRPAPAATTPAPTVTVTAPAGAPTTAPTPTDQATTGTPAPAPTTQGAGDPTTGPPPTAPESTSPANPPTPAP